MTIRWGLIGCGDIARRRVARAIIDNAGCELLAACRRDERKLREFCDEFAVERAYANDEQLINDPDIDAVYIATPVNLHLPQTIAAAAASKHVLVEKPMAMSVAECDEMIAACRRSGVKLGVAYYRRFYPVAARMKEVIAAGEIGQPMTFSVTTAAAFAINPGEDGYWRVIPEQGGGGALMDIGSHRINLLLDMFGEVADVKAFCSTITASYDSEDCASLVIRFRSGVHGTLQCLFGARVDPDEFTVIGTQGRMSSSPLNGGDLSIRTTKDHRVESHPPHDNFNFPLIADFVDAIREDRDPTVSGEEGRAANVVMQLAYKDAAS